MKVSVQGTAQTSPSPAPSAAATDEDRGGTKKARQRKRKDPEVVDERTMRVQKRMVCSRVVPLSVDVFEALLGVPAFRAADAVLCCKCFFAR